MWGAGHNKTNGIIKTYNVSPSKFGFFGTRDFGLNNDWVPCVSCLHPIFDSKYKIEHEIGVVFHKINKDKPKVLDKFKEYPSTMNSVSLEEIVTFIGSCETIITDSYHGMYWSLLLGKKVMRFSESSKFLDFKYPVIKTTPDDFKRHLKLLNPFSGIKEEARSINIEFAQKAFDYLGL